MSENAIDIIIPTWNLPEFLNPCVASIKRGGFLNGLARVIIVNNGEQRCDEDFAKENGITVIKAPRNLGWEGGLALGLKHSKAPFVCFQNDDTHIPPSEHYFYNLLLHPFNDPKVGAVGPVTTVAAGPQSVYSPMCPSGLSEAGFLIFFCVMLKRSILDEVGGIDETLPGGDDLDLSLRLRKAGYKLLIQPHSFLIHHAFKTGERVRGSAGTAGGWNSRDMIERTNTALIRKHGFKAFSSIWRLEHPKDGGNGPIDYEGNIVREFIKGENILELGCRFRKTVPSSLGLDRVEGGSLIPHVSQKSSEVSVADIVGDVTKILPFEDQKFEAVIARHVLEHCIDLVSTLTEWKRIVRIGGRLILAVPNENVTRSIPLNPEHVHAFTAESLASLGKLLGLKLIGSKNDSVSNSVVVCFEREN